MKLEIETIVRQNEQGKRGSIQTWLDEGYSIFSLEGPSSIQIERVARKLNKNKSGFYYFFKDRESFVDCLMKAHLGRLDALIPQIREIRNFEPEYFDLLIKNKETLFFQVQLVKNREIELFNDTLSQFNARIAVAVIPVWSDYLESAIDVGGKLWALTRDAIYCRATQENFTHSWLLDLMSEAKVIASYQNSQSLAY
jgi:AcrR family transcriptional regulator